MFADQYTIYERRKKYRFDMRPLKQRMRECGVSMEPGEEKAEALCDEIAALLDAAIEQAYHEGRLDARMDD